MLIVFQNKTVLLNVDHIVRIFNAGAEVLAVDLNKDTNLLGEYEDTTRAVAVLAEIAEEYAKYYRCSGGPILTHPGGYVQPMMFEPPKLFKMPEK